MTGYRTRRSAIALFIGLGLSGGPALHAFSPPVRTVRELAGLTPEQASGHPRTELDATVTYSDGEWGLLFVEDGTGGTFVDVKATKSSFAHGTRLRIKGYADKGDLRAVVRNPEFEVTGNADSPKPLSASVARLDIGEMDSRWVETEGVLRPSELWTWYRMSFRIYDGEKYAVVVIPKRDDELVERLIGTKVRIRGVAAAHLKNGRRIGALLFVGDPSDIVVEHPAAADPYEIPKTSVSDLHRLNQEERFAGRIRLTGTVVYRKGRLMLVEDHGQMATVILRSESEIRPGHMANVIGFPSRTAYGWGLSDAGVRGWIPNPPQEIPQPGWADGASLPKSAGQLVRLQGRLTQTAGGGRILWIESKKELVRAFVPEGNDPLNLPNGSMVEVTGIVIPVSHEGLTEDSRRSPQVQRPLGALAVLDANMIPETDGAVWRYAIAAAIAALILTAAAMAWVSILRRTVRKQLAAIREAHDNLERRVEERTRELTVEIAARQLVERDLVQARNEAEAASRAKSAFLANMSHELRTPLSAIIGYSELIQEDAHAAGQTEANQDLLRIQMAARQLLTLINEVLDLSKIEAGSMVLRMELVSALALIEDVIPTVAPIAQRNKNRLVVESADADATVNVDPVRFRQSLLNLLSNACKFTQEGTVTVSLSREELEGKQWVCWGVQDTGIGIAPGDQSKLFQAFSQVDSSATRRYDGTGLGLSISQNLCRLMGGEIAVRSEPGRGSVFTIRMPAVERARPES